MSITLKELKKRAAVSVAACALALCLAALTGCASGTAEGETGASANSGQEQTQAPETVTVKSLNANKEEVDLDVPFDAQRIAVMDMACLDIVNDLGLGDRVVGSSDTTIDYLQSYVNNDAVANLGTIKEADMEAVMACEPDVIFIGGRLSASYDALSEIAPVVYLATDTEKGLVESVRANASTIASMFGMEDEVDGKMAAFDSRIEALQKAANGQTAVVGLFTSGSLNVLGNDGRCSIIGSEIGFDNLAAGEVTSTHGNEASFETVVQLNPDWIFVMNRDAAIGSDGAGQAQEVVENDLTKATTAYQNGHIVYLAHPAVWYTAEGGIEALDVMLSDLEEAVL